MYVTAPMLVAPSAPSNRKTVTLGTVAPVVPAVSSSATELALLDEEPGVCALWRLNDVIVGAWRQQATEHSVRRLIGAMDYLVPRYPSGFSGIHLIREGTAPPTADARRLLVEAMESHGGNVAAIGLVFMGGGFWASALHAAITGIRMISRRSVEMRIDGALGPTVRWLCPLHTKRTGRPVAPDELSRAAETAFSRIVQDDDAIALARQRKI
jgi:hypothetical protein